MEEHFVCIGGLGAGAKLSRVMFDVVMKASIAQPLLDFSERRMQFEYVHVLPEDGRGQELLRSQGEVL